VKRNLFPCPVKTCPCLKEAGALFCDVHWKQVKPQDQQYFWFFSNEGNFDLVRRMVAAQSSIFATSPDTPTPLTGGIRCTKTPNITQNHAQG